MRRRADSLGLLVTLLVGLLPFGAHANPKALFEEVEARIEAWDLEGARNVLTLLEKLGLTDAEPFLYYQGRLAFEEGRYDDAAKLLERAGASDKPGGFLQLAKDTGELTRTYQHHQSEHFIFSYPPGKDAVLAPYALETLERIRAALLEDLGHAPPGKIRVEVVANARELAKVSTLTHKQIQTTGTIAICKFSKLMVTSPKAVVHGYDWLDTLAHEYVHLVVSQKGANKVPIWLHEGLAKYLESRWRGKAGLALAPYSQALLGGRVKKNQLIPFEKMHPSIALLPSAEDAATAFAEVFYAIDLLTREKGTQGLRTVIEALRDGHNDKKAVELAFGRPFPAFERAWMAHLSKQPYPQELVGRVEKNVVLKEDQPGAEPDAKDKGKEIAFGDFAEVEEVDARRFAHLGELMRERNRPLAAAREFSKAHRQVGNKYEFVSNKYALALLELGQLDEAEQVLEGSLQIHPSHAATHVHLGRIHLQRQHWDAARGAYREALATDPFDPEIHFALARIEKERQDETLARRAREAASLLSELPLAQVDTVVQKLFPTPSQAPPSAPRKDENK